MPTFSPRVAWLAGKGSAAWEIHSEALAASATDKCVIVLSVGDPEFSTPEHITEKAVEALRAGDTHYAEVLGRDTLRQAIIDELARLGGPAMSPENIIVLAGTQNALITASLCLLSPGDEVIALDPMYVTYEAFLSVSGAKLIRVPCNADEGFRPNIAAISDAITDKTKAIVFSNPNNPTGVVMSKDEITGIADLAKAHDLWVISDEVYGSLNFEEPHRMIASLPQMAERTVTVSSLSKSHAMTGWRVGWMAGPKELIEHAEKLALCMLYGLPGFIQDAATEALTNGAMHRDAMKEIYRKRRDLVVKEFDGSKQLKVLTPQSGMFVLIDIRKTGMGSAEFSRKLYAHEKVSVLDGAAFGSAAEGFVRLSFTSQDDVLVEGCRRIIKFASGYL